MDFCYYVKDEDLLDRKRATVGLVMVVANEKGYRSTDLTVPRATAREACAAMNERLGLTPAKVDAIVASSMFNVHYPENLQSQQAASS